MEWTAWLYLGGMAVVTAVLVYVIVVGAGYGSWLRRRAGRRVTVHTTEDRSIEGVLRHDGRDGIVLSAAKWLEPATDLGGDVWVPREKILFLQVP